MRTTEQLLCELSEQYLQALAGNDAISALKIHAQKAGVNLRFFRYAGAEIEIATNMFKAANAQRKISNLIDVIQEDGFPLMMSSDFLDYINGSSLELVDHGAEKTKSAEDHHVDFELSYRRWLEKETEYIDIRGIGEQKTSQAIVFPILSLYTELYVQIGLTNLDLDQGRMRGHKRISLSQMVLATRCLMIMGDPGSGKTTFLRFIARKGASITDDPLPIYIRLSDVCDYALRENLPFRPNLFISYLSHLCEQERLEHDNKIFSTLIDNGRCLFLLDSLDELPSEDIREKMVSLVGKAARQWDKCKFVMTSRPVPQKAKIVPGGFECVGIDNWTKDDIKSFLQAWTSTLYPNATDEQQRRHWGLLLSTIMERTDLRSLSRNAVMVTAMAVIHYNERKLPEGRADLLESLIYWLIRAKHRLADIPYSSAKFVECRYREIALAMMEFEGGRRRRVGRGWAADVISCCFDGETEEIRKEAALEFLSREETDTGVLVRRGVGDVEFWHLSFMEYLAAKEIAGKTDDIEKGWWPKLVGHLEEAEWREVLIFVPACLNRLGGERVDLFFERLGASSANKSLSIKARTAALGGCILRDLKLTGYLPTEAHSWAKIMSDVRPLFEAAGQDIPLDIKYDAALAYGLGGDVSLRDFESTWIGIPAGKFLMGAQAQNPDAPNYDKVAAHWEGPVIEVTVPCFELRKYPITVQEFGEFVKDGGYWVEQFWVNDYLLNSVDEGWIWKSRGGISMPLDWEEQLLTPNCPVTGVSWYEAQAYCHWLSLTDIRKIKYRLPTEAEWEYASKRGHEKGQLFPWGNTVTPGDNIEANFAWSGLRKKNPIGIFHKCVTIDGIIDMFGNVEEWCLDSWSSSHLQRTLYGDRPYIDPAEPAHIVRGGSTIRFPRLCRPTYRSRIWKDQRYHPVGFRPLRIREE